MKSLEEIKEMPLNSFHLKYSRPAVSETSQEEKGTSLLKLQARCIYFTFVVISITHPHSILKSLNRLTTENENI